MKKEEQSIEVLLEKIKELHRIIEAKDRQIAALEEKVDYLVRQKFAPSSEKLVSKQPSLFDPPDDEEEELPRSEEASDKKPRPPKRKKRGGRSVPPETLPRIRVEHDLKEEQKVCECGSKMQRIKEIVSHQYDVVPARFQVIENVRFVYACPCGCGAKVKSSPLAPQVLPRHQVSPSLLATIAVGKFEDALPLERQAKIFKNRFGVTLSSTTLSEWLIKASWLRLEPLMERLRSVQSQSDYSRADETTLQVLNEPGKKAQSKSYLWMVVSEQKHPVVRVHYSPNRAGATAEALLEDFTGYLQTDGYGGYNSVAKKEGVTQLGCWAHARRKFAEILSSGVSGTRSKELAEEVVSLMAKLYGIEKVIKEKPPDEKRRYRQEKAKPIVEKIRSWMEEHFFAAQKLGGAIARAFVYLNNQFAKLTVYLEDGRLTIDNNRAENHIRPIALGRKNWLFATSTRGAEALANWYSVIETAKANGVEPYAYLCHLLTEMPRYQAEGKDIDALLPWNVSLA